MRILSLYLLLSFTFSIEYAILYDDNFSIQANTISELYNSEVNAQFQLTTETFSNNYINENYAGDNLSEKIRNFINELIDLNTEIKYILILGDENSFPPIYTSNDIPSDDFYLQNTMNNFNLPPQISVGRIPTSDVNKINNFVSKLSDFLTNPTIGRWRDKAVLIADDEHKNGENEACEIKHTINSDIIYDILSPYMNVKTLYGVEYEPITTSDGLYHSELNQSIIDEINDGVALINYIGHGDQRTLSAEKIIDMERDMGQIYAKENKLGVWVVGTCKFGQYDNEDCMAEQLITDRDASIGVISTVRSVSSSYNIDFLEYLFTEYTNHFTPGDVIRVGDIIKEAKNNSYNDNPNFYQGYLFHLFGDPALPIFSSIQQPSEEVSIESINIGEINNVDILDYDLGSLEINFNDYESQDYYYGDPTISCDGELNYTIPGNNIFKNNFSENSCYTIPLDAMSCTNCDLKIQLYYQNEGEYNGVSYIKNDIILEVDEAILEMNDQTGPEIRFSKFNDHYLYNNSNIPLNSDLIVNISDSLGVNIYNGIGHNFRYWFNNENESYNINSDFFNYNNSCSGSGTLTITVPESYTGYNTIYFEAWDNYNNRTEESINLNILDYDRENTVITNFLNLPNPFKQNTHFTFQIPEAANFPINMEINIFNLGGEKIKNLTLKNINEPFHSVTWDGSNNLNQELPNGTYIVYVTAWSSNGNKQSKKHIITKIK